MFAMNTCDTTPAPPGCALSPFPSTRIARKLYGGPWKIARRAPRQLPIGAQRPKERCIRHEAQSPLLIERENARGKVIPTLCRLKWLVGGGNEHTVSSILNCNNNDIHIYNNAIIHRCNHHESNVSFIPCCAWQV
jgi:hypothetical protein